MDNQYYILKPAVGTKETGMAYPAVESYEDYDFNAPNSMHKIKFNEFPNFIPDIRFKLTKGAKLCDMMGQATINAKGFIISEKLKLIFEQANTVPCKFYCAFIEDKETIHKYYWVHFVWDMSFEYIDYKNSLFFIKRGLRNIGDIIIDSYENFIIENDKMDSVNYIAYKKLKLKYLIPFDCFIIKHSTEIYLSYNLYSKFKADSISGINIESASDIFI